VGGWSCGWRHKKTLRLERQGLTLALHHSMHDNVHGFEVHYAIDVPTGRRTRFC